MTDSKNRPGHGLGCKFDGAGHGLPAAMGLFGARVPQMVPASFALTIDPEIRDQRGSSACVAHALCCGIRDRLLAQGVKSPRLPSILWAYYVARRADGVEHEDGGCYPRHAIQAIRAQGYPEEAVWQFDELAVYDPPPLLSYTHAADQRGKASLHRVSDGPSRQDEIRALVSGGIPLLIGTQVDLAFEDLTDGVWDFAGPSLGGHALEIVAYNPDGVTVRNSWGTGWSSGGFGEIGWKSIRDPSVTADVYAVDSCVNFSEESRGDVRPLAR